MKLIDYEWLADENIHPDWINFCRNITPVHTLSQFNLLGKSDAEILKFSNDNHFIVFTQDSDFGHLAIAHNQPFLGIVFLRPGHLNPSIHLATIRKILDQNIDLSPPFILVGSYNNTSINIRIRNNIKAD